MDFRYVAILTDFGITLHVYFPILCKPDITSRVEPNSSELQ